MGSGQSTDRSRKRVGLISHKVKVKALEPGDHIYVCCGLQRRKHGIYTGNPAHKVIYCSEHEPFYPQADTLENFLEGKKPRLVAYDVGTVAWLLKKSYSVHRYKSVPAETIVTSAEFYLANPKEWQSKRRRDLPFYCKTRFCPEPNMSLDCTDRDIASLGTNIRREDLHPGDHIYVNRKFGLISYSHHGIYTGKGGHEVIHFAGVRKEKRTARIQSSTLEGFLNGGTLQITAYSAPKKFFTPHNYYSLRPLPIEEVLHRAEYYLQHLQEWSGYSLLMNNCEDFAFYCKRGYAISGQVVRIVTARSLPVKRFMEKSTAFN